MVAMQNILPVICFLAGFALAWLVLRHHTRETEAAFKALSADALVRNNQAFLDLAKSTLAEAQQAARGDLDLRQEGVCDLVAPCAPRSKKSIPKSTTWKGPAPTPRASMPA
jgi:DNA recombination protein RmuC